MAVSHNLDQDDPLVGQIIAGRYRILDRIGRGGMGAIYEAEHQTTRKRFAVKTLLPGLGRVGEIARRFEREAKAASLLDHPNIVSVVDFGTVEDGSLFLAMELVRGKSLGDLIDARLPVARGLRIARQVLEALSHAHRHGVIHRDLKPDNVMVLDAGTSDEERDLVKLLDFGIAKLLDEAAEGQEKLTQAGVAFGTPDYMAPEQALGEPVDGRADLYAMGVILYEIVAGRKPYVNADKMAVLRMHVAVPPPSLTEATGRPQHAKVEALFERALAKPRTDRFASADEMIAALDEAAPSILDPSSPREVVSAPPAPPVMPASGSADTIPASPSLGAPEPPPQLGALLSHGLLADLRRSQPFLARVALFGLPALTLLIVVIILLARGGGSKRDVGPGLGARAMGADVPHSDLAKRAEKLLASGDAQGAIALLDDGLSSGDGQRDAYGHMVLGHARAKVNRDVEALAAYERAVALAPSLAEDETMRKNVEAMVGKKDKTIALAALDFLGNRVGKGEEPLIIDLASHSNVMQLRDRARELADRRGVLDKVDLVYSYGADLAQGSSCAERKQYVPKLRALKDKRAIQILNNARYRTGGGFFGGDAVNGCLSDDAKEAIDFLEALP